jgi:hypothetical protein
VAPKIPSTHGQKRVQFQVMTLLNAMMSEVKKLESLEKKKADEVAKIICRYEAR